ncbi:MAG: GNAT family N-acetyltransferase [Anaerolineales bacterium]|nr:GNAT family N-acetyltransferase [Anaerolineales bacterium]
MSVAPLALDARSTLSGLLDGRRAGDAMALYYALLHPAAKTRLWAHRSSGGGLDGFLVRAQTGQDLFRPLVTLRAKDAASISELLRAAFPAPRAAIFSVPEALSLWVLPRITPEKIQQILLFRLDPARLEPLVNIFVRRAESPGGLPRFEIRRDDRLLAAAGVNWQSSDWAEVFVHADPQVRERGYGKSVCAALCRQLLEEKRRILFAVEEGNAGSLHLARSLGFEDTGEREVLCYGSVAAISEGAP